MQQDACFSMRRGPPGRLEMHFSLPCWQLFATMALAIEWQ
jgi:hypothetical protein